MPDRELFRRFPAARKLPFVELATLPTPVERLEATERELGLTELWVKRDDRSGTFYGGNKVRKLEFLLGDAVAQGHDEVCTVGAIGSHHVLATCTYARELGLACGALHFPQPLTPHVLDNLRALSTTQPKLTLIGHPEPVAVEDFKDEIRDWRADNPDAYYIPAGGSSPVGALGYVNAALELGRQIEQGVLPCPDVVYVAAGTCGTHAGLILGFKLAGLKITVRGVRVVDRAIANKPVVANLANRCAELLRDAGVEDVPHVAHAEVEILDEFIGEDYGVATKLGLEARDMLGALDDLKLEPTYTAKAFSAILSAREQLASSKKRVLYWHTLSGADLSERVASAEPERDLPAVYGDFFDE